MAILDKKRDQNGKPDSSATDSKWTLTAAQIAFMLVYHNAIEEAFAKDNLDSLREMAASSDFKSVFGEMSFDEAYDRYETVLGAEEAHKWLLIVERAAQEELDRLPSEELKPVFSAI